MLSHWEISPPARRAEELARGPVHGDPAAVKKDPINEHDDVACRHPDAPPGRRRRVALVVVAVSLLVQLVVPANYYIGEASADERFSWRMFSSRRAEKCRVQAFESTGSGGAGPMVKLRLPAIIHQSWINGLSRRRTAIVERFFEWRCDEPGVVEVKLVRHCRDALGETLPLDTIEHRCEGGP